MSRSLPITYWKVTSKVWRSRLKKQKSLADKINKAFQVLIGKKEKGNLSTY